MFSKLFEERSGGRVKAELYPAASLFGANQIFLPLVENVVQVANFNTSYELDKFGVAAAIMNMPYNWNIDLWLAHSRDPGGWYDWLEPYYTKNGLKLLIKLHATSIVFASRTPIRTVEDFKGKLIKCVPGGQAEALDILGAEPVFISSAEGAMALQKGTIDAASNGVGTVVSRLMYESAPYISFWDMMTSGIELGMNLEFYNSLPPDLRELVNEIALEIEHQYYTTWNPAELEANVATLKSDPNVEIIIPPDAELKRFEKAIRPVYDKMARDYGDEWAFFAVIRKDLVK